MKKLFSRYFSVFLSLALIFTTVVIINNNNYNGNGILVKKFKNGNIEAKKVVEGSLMKAVYTKDEEKYTLYRDEQTYEIDVSTYDKNIVIDLDSNTNINVDEKVVGQFAMALPLIYWTPAIIAAAKAVIGCVAIAATGYTVWYTTDSIAKTIDKTESIPKVRSKPQTGYYSAALVNGTMVISYQISHAAAVSRLIAGMDVFCTSQIGASSIATEAGINMMFPTWHKPHGGDGYYPHYHPYGRKWINNKNHSPHSWYAPLN